MNDRELLLAAAKAAGLVVVSGSAPVTLYVAMDGCIAGARWNPLTDDGDALRLRNRMDAIVANEGCCVYVEINLYPHPTVQIRETYTRDLDGGYASQSAVDAATRRAITRAAASIGEAMP